MLGLLYLAHPWTWDLEWPGLWFAPAGLGLLLVAWLGKRGLVLVAVSGLLVGLQAHVTGVPTVWGAGWKGLAGVAGEGLLTAAEVGAAWWCFLRAARACLRARYGSIVFDTVIRSSIAYAESARRSCSILDERPDLGTDYLALAREVLDRLPALAAASEPPIEVARAHTATGALAFAESPPPSTVPAPAPPPPPAAAAAAAAAI